MAATDAERAPGPRERSGILRPAIDSADPADLTARWSAVLRRIAAAASAAGRPAADITLVAVSKTVGAEAVAALHAAGQREFGEGRAQELTAKRAALTAVPGAGPVWHFVGRLQRNKVRHVVGAATVLHGVDRRELALAIAARARAEGLVQRVLLQVNTGGDAAKAGCRPDEAEALAAEVAALPGVVCEGLMTIPAHGVDPRPAFALLRALRDDVRARVDTVRHLSMGMSGDFEVAVTEGATIVRVGEAVFGPRPAPDATPSAPPPDRPQHLRGAA